MSLWSGYDDGTHDRVDDSKTKIWLNKEGLVHREDDKPAKISSSGSMRWFINGKPYRENNKPNCIHTALGFRAWYIDSKVHVNNEFFDEFIIRPELKHYLAALEDDFSYINNWQFRSGISHFDISLDYQQKLIQSDPSIAKYIRNLDSKYSHLILGNKFGIFDDV